MMTIFYNQVYSQETTVEGVVYDENDTPIQGATVIEKGTSNAITTDGDGSFTIKVQSPESILVVSFFGYRSDDIIASNASKIALTVSAEDLDEVVVVAYGEKSKKAITGAISEIKSEDISNQISATPLKAIQGSAPGVNIITQGGQPGNTPSIRIRGFGSVNASAAPLIVLDGVPFNGELSSISQDQIKSISILKDAASAALYGSRAANGVILITTKKGGKSKETQVTVSSRGGVSQLAVQQHQLVDSKKYYELSWEALKNKYVYTDSKSDAEARDLATKNLLTLFGGYNSTKSNQPVGIDGNFDSNTDLLWETDWLEEINRDQATYIDHTVSVSGGGKKSTYFASVNYLDYDGLVKNSNFERSTARLNFTTELKEWLEFGSNNSFSVSKQNNPQQSGSSYSSAILWYYNVPSVYPLYRRNGNGSFLLDNGKKQYDYGQYGGDVNDNRPRFSNGNPLGYLENDKFNQQRNNLFSTNSLKFDLYDGLTLNTKLGYENQLYLGDFYTNYKEGPAKSVSGRVSEYRTTIESYTFTNSLDYNMSLKEQHNINIKLLTEVYDFNIENFTASGTGLLPNSYVLSATTKPEIVSGYTNQERILSYLGQINYDFEKRYYLDFSFRTDGSSRFREEKRWGDFYSVGANWIISDESFIKDIFSDEISLLKLRASYGQLGNNKLLDNTGKQAYFPYIRGYQTGNGNLDIPGVVLQKVIDKDISWETSTVSGVGLDYGFLQNKITGTIEYYDKSTKDLLFNVPVSLSNGSNSISTNAGTIKNSGIEFNITTEVFKTDDINIDLNFNLATIKNEFTELPQEEIIVDSKKYQVGKSLYDFFIRDYADVNPDNGRMRWWKDILDEEGNPTGKKEKTEEYNDATRYYSGSSIPDFYGGFGLEANAYGFGLTAQFSYSYGAKVLDYTYANVFARYTGTPLSQDVEKRWTKKGDITDVPLLINENTSFNSSSTRFLFDNDYIRLRNVTLSYKLPKDILENIHLSSMTLNITGENIFTWQSHEGIDPEQSFAGTTNNRTGSMKTYSLGVSLQF